MLKASHSKLLTNTEVSIKGGRKAVPSALIRGRTVVVRRRWPRIASIHGEEWLQGELISDTNSFLEELRGSPLRVDLFTFPQRFTDSAPKLQTPYQWDNAAVVPIESYDEWWRNLSQDVRRNVRRAAKLGVIVESVPFEETLIRGIKTLYDECPVRQGRTFWHYGKSLETVRHDNASYLDRSEFLAAWCGDRLIGFIKMVYVDDSAQIMQILSSAQEFDKRPANALIAKAIAVCASKRIRYLVYRKYHYGPDKDSSLTEFKRRNGFQEFRFPRYYVPFTILGRLVLTCGLQEGIGKLVPHLAARTWVRWRTRWLEAKYKSSASQARET